MSLAKVIADPRFLSRDRIKELHEEGASVSVEALLANVKLSEPAYGEETVGTLEPEEASIFAELFGLTEQMAVAKRRLFAAGFKQVGEVLTSEDTTDMAGAFEQANPFRGDAAKDFFRLQQKVGMLHATLHFYLGERFDSHDWRLGVRSRGRVVRIAQRSE